MLILSETFFELGGVEKRNNKNISTPWSATFLENNNFLSSKEIHFSLFRPADALFDVCYMLINTDKKKQYFQMYNMYGKFQMVLKFLYQLKQQKDY